MYSRIAQIILGIIGFFFILYVGQEILIPVVFAILIAILLNPIVNFLCSKKINRIISIVIAILFLTIVFGALGFFIITQVGQFSDTFPLFKEKFSILTNDILHWAADTFKISEPRIKEWISKSQKNIDGMMVLEGVMGTLKGMLAVFVMPVLIFIVLYYKPLFLEFIMELFEKREQGVVSEVFTETKSLIQQYLVGLSIEAIIVAVLNCAGLLILGIPYAILLGVLSALLNVIPYIGILSASALTILIAMTMKSAGAGLSVFILFLIVQFIDNQYILPKIVAGKVQVNPLFSIVVVFAGGALWGIPGMFLAIPLTAIVKVIFDRVDSLKPFGLLLGDTIPGQAKSTGKSSKK
ncbi:MAG: AI-2E family transporter [Cyclobacteriaceae bacterium]|nr:AI-2E family transporter [Cyclobacteriaceae bacterium]